MPADNTTVVILDRSISSLERVQTSLERIWRNHPWIGSADRMAVETALVELASNVIRYALYDEGSEAQLGLTVEEMQLVAQLVDHGREFHGDLENVTMPGLDAESGRGLAVIDMLMDVFEYRRLSTQNRWTLVRRLRMEAANR